MFNVYWGNCLLGTYPDQSENQFKQFCNINQISYQYHNDVGNYFLFPVLKGITIALCPIDSQKSEAKKVVKNIADKLTPWGALVMHIEDKTKFMKLIKILKVQVLLCITENKPNSGKSRVKFFYSLKKKEESIGVIAAMAERLMRQKMELSYEVANLYDFLFNPQYLKYYLSDVTTVLIEINALQEYVISEFEKVLIDGLVDKYSAINMEEQTARVKELLAHIEETLVKEVVGINEQEDKGEDEIDEDESLYNTNEENNITIIEPKVILKNEIVKENPIQKNKNRRHSKATLFPPGDGPVYQFRHPLNCEMYSNAPVPEDTNGGNKNSYSKSTCSSFNLVNNSYPIKTLSYESFNKTEHSYSVLDELKDISQKVMLHKKIEDNSTAIKRD